jgi:2-oxoglutarate dehydrogenase E2 component (dihydrolipoamide succinyltransferase)
MTEVPMPKLSMNMSEGVVIEWLVEDGERVEPDQEIAEIESDKATSVLEAPASGTIAIAAGAGEQVEVGTSIATISSDGEAERSEADRGPREPSQSQTV